MEFGSVPFACMDSTILRNDENDTRDISHRVWPFE